MTTRYEPNAAAKTPAFYEPLDTTKSEIRLLSISPAWDNASTIRCSLTTLSLDTKPVYEAMSYSWGASTDTVTIVVNGAPFAATRNLVAGLRRFRARDLGRARVMLWIDAICINQCDLGERAQQVGMMADIYRGADHTRAWIGEPSGDMAMGFELFKGFAALAHFVPEDGTQATAVNCSAVAALATLPYWTRIWVVQELTLSRAVVFFCGVLETAVSSWNAVARKCLEFDRHIDLAYASRSRYIRFPVLQTVALLADGVNRVKPHPVLKQSLAALTMIKQLSASEPHDYVYGIIGLLPSYIAVNPDYSQRPTVVFEEATKSFIRNSRSLDILLYFAFANLADSPSWICRFDRPWSNISCLSTSYGSYDASANMTVTALYPSHGVLRVLGLLVDVVVDTSVEQDRSVSVHPEDLQILHNWRAMHRTLPNSVPSAASQSPLLGNFDEFAAIRQVARYSEGTITENWSSEIRRCASTGVHTEDCNGLHRLAKQASFFLGREGYFGLAAKDRVQAGDRLTILAGCSAPIVLRPAVWHGRLGFTVIGPAFVSGVMHGEHVLALTKALGGLLGQDAGLQEAGVFEEIDLV